MGGGGGGKTHPNTQALEIGDDGYCTWLRTQIQGVDCCLVCMAMYAYVCLCLAM